MTCDVHRRKRYRLILLLYLVHHRSYRAGHIILLFTRFLPRLFGNINILSFPQQCWLQYNSGDEIRLTENGTSRTKHVKPLVPILDERLRSPNLFLPTSRSLKSTPCCVLHPVQLRATSACILVILQPLTRITRLRRSCFTVR